jgi:glycosyltransferase involved in cell wall biosynthesis
MDILMIADPHVPVPPSHYGGIERVVSLYAEEFARLGHRVDLLAGTGSSSYGGSLFIHHPPSKSYLSRAHRKIRFQLQSCLVAKRSQVVYNFGRFDYLEALLAFGKPLLHCFQNPVDQDQINFAESRTHSRSSFHFISSHQHSLVSSSTASTIIHNPIDSRFYACQDDAEGYLCFLGRLTYNKGVDKAISVALRAERKLIIAGNIPAEDGAAEFFRDHVEPFLDGDQIRWVGPVDDAQKKSLLARADALLFPIRWNEPFGIVMAEALACGCPVIATRCASVPEVIDHGVTGFLCNNDGTDVSSFVHAVHDIPSLNRDDCRSAALSRFDIRALAPKVLAELTRLSE